MSDKLRSVTHATFSVERRFKAAPAKVFAAVSDASEKRQWFVDAEGWTTEFYEMDFRVGGSENYRGTAPDGATKVSAATLYHDIIVNERLIYAYEMALNGTRISVSVATMELKPAGDGTRLVLTEQGAFLDGFDDPSGREHGTNELMDALVKYVDGPNG